MILNSWNGNYVKLRKCVQIRRLICIVNYNQFKIIQLIQDSNKIEYTLTHRIRNLGNRAFHDGICKRMEIHRHGIHDIEVVYVHNIHDRLEEVLLIPFLPW